MTRCQRFWEMGKEDLAAWIDDLRKGKSAVLDRQRECVLPSSRPLTGAG